MFRLLLLLVVFKIIIAKQVLLSLVSFYSILFLFVSLFTLNVYSMHIGGIRYFTRKGVWPWPSQIDVISLSSLVSFFLWVVIVIMIVHTISFVFCFYCTLRFNLSMKLASYTLPSLNSSCSLNHNIDLFWCWSHIYPSYL